VDEARTVIRRLERIESLRGADAPAAELLAEVRQLLREGEAWLAVEREEDAGGRPPARSLPTEGAAAALAGCRTSLAAREEVRPGKAESASL
jgi:hypothetical protein